MEEKKEGFLLSFLTVLLVVAIDVSKALEKNLYETKNYFISFLSNAAFLIA